MEPERVELVFVPLPIISHLLSTVEVAKHLLHHDHRLSITVIILKINFDTTITSYIDSISNAGINFITIPSCHHHQSDHEYPDDNLPKGLSLLLSLIEENKHLVKDAVEKMMVGSRLAGFVIDMFFTSIIDVANHFGVPTYLFYVCGAAFLGLQLYVQEKNVDTESFKDADDLHLDMPLFRNPYPANLLPSYMLNRKSAQKLGKIAQRYKETKGIMVNTFQELESYSIDALITCDQKIPPVYPVGPILHVSGGDDRRDGNINKENVIITWLDDQPKMSAVFLCFGSMGSFDVEQVKEIAAALERSGHRFLWSLRRPPPRGETMLLTDYEKVEEVLPEGFLNRTAGIGKVIGWAPQVAVLSHPAVGGFVSHCGWNSTLESLWFGVPLAAWPLYADNQVAAFEMVVELGLGVEVRMEYRIDPVTGEPNGVVTAAEIERAIEQLMENESEVRKKVKEMSEQSRKALTEGGSSRAHLARFIQDVMANIETCK